jgi:hypothetical protein
MPLSKGRAVWAPQLKPVQTSSNHKLKNQDSQTEKPSSPRPFWGQGGWRVQDSTHLTVPFALKVLENCHFSRMPKNNS